MHWRYILRLVEFLLIFIGVPLVFYFDILPLRKIVALLIITFVCVGILWRDKTYDLRRLSYFSPNPRQLKKILFRSGTVALSLIFLVLVLQPDQLFALPEQRPRIWGIILLLYPVISALPQEILYREFFFHRYEKILGSGGWLIAASAGSFCFLHIVYDNVWALLISFIGGLLFAQTYRQTRSLYWVSLEHAIYGCLIFTIGLGNYFYEPI